MKVRKMKEKKIQIIHYLKFERIFVRPEKKKEKEKPLRSVCTIEKEKILRRSKVWGMGGRGTVYYGCNAQVPPPNPAL